MAPLLMFSSPFLMDNPLALVLAMDQNGLFVMIPSSLATPVCLSVYNLPVSTDVSVSARTPFSHRSRTMTWRTCSSS